MADEVRSPAHIDVDDLPGECVRQPRLYFKFSRLLADKKRQLAELEAELEVVEAEALLEFRRDPVGAGLMEAPDPKNKKPAKEPTVDLFKAAVKTHPLVRKLVLKIIGRKHAVDVVQGYVTTLDHRKRMIEQLVEQKVKDFFGEPKVPARYKEEVADERAVRARRRAAGVK